MREKRKKEKKKGKKEEEGESEWNTCPIMGGWEEIMLSPLSQLGVNTWQGEISF
jgi:hypothetical protein